MKTKMNADEEVQDQEGGGEEEEEEEEEKKKKKKPHEQGFSPLRCILRISTGV
jgi:hypothetical protein